jgi:hypothetical protein
VIVAYALREATLIFFRPSSNFAVFSLTNDNREHVRGISRIYDALLLGQIHQPDLGGPHVKFFTPPPSDFFWHKVPARLLEISWVLLIAYAAVFLGGIQLVRREIRAHGRSSPEVAVLTFCLVTVAYVCVVGNLLEAGENNRFHILTDPLVIVILSIMIARSDLARRLRKSIGEYRLTRNGDHARQTEGSRGDATGP